MARNSRTRSSEERFEQLPEEYQNAKPKFIEEVRRYEGHKYYLVHFEDDVTPVYLRHDQGLDLTLLIKEFKLRPKEDRSIEPLEWEVQSIEDSKEVDGQTYYLVKWKYWIGESTWLHEDDCDCMNLIAAHENPKLSRLFSFSANNKNLWVSHSQMNFFIRKVVGSVEDKPNILECKSDLNCSDWLENIQEGLNLGCLTQEQHWYVVFIFKDYIISTNYILVLDSLNTMIVPNLKHHPVYAKLKKIFPKHTIRPARMTPMERSDMCAYYALAAIERGLFLINPRAHFICESILFHPVRAEYLRSLLAPETNGQMTYSLKLKDGLIPCPTCEFCRETYEDYTELDKHIINKHFSKRTNPKLLAERLSENHDHCYNGEPMSRSFSSKFLID